jgi:hypothetical protein
MAVPSRANIIAKLQIHAGLDREQKKEKIADFLADLNTPLEDRQKIIDDLESYEDY